MVAIIDNNEKNDTKGTNYDQRKDRDKHSMICLIFFQLILPSTCIIYVYIESYLWESWCILVPSLLYSMTLEPRLSAIYQSSCTSSWSFHSVFFQHFTNVAAYGAKASAENLSYRYNACFLTSSWTLPFSSVLTNMPTSSPLVHGIAASTFRKVARKWSNPS